MSLPFSIQLQLSHKSFLMYYLIISFIHHSYFDFMHLHILCKNLQKDTNFDISVLHCEWQLASYNLMWNLFTFTNLLIELHCIIVNIMYVQNFSSIVLSCTVKKQFTNITFVCKWNIIASDINCIIIQRMFTKSEFDNFKLHCERHFVNRFSAEFVCI